MEYIKCYFKDTDAWKKSFEGENQYKWSRLDALLETSEVILEMLLHKYVSLDFIFSLFQDYTIVYQDNLCFTIRELYGQNNYTS